MTNPLFTPYLIPSAPVIYEEEIKKSRFITYLAHSPSVESAKTFINEIKALHANARHNCWAFVAGRPSDSMSYGFSDDGEPSGTAGKPILAQLSGSNVGEVVAVVTRYYGGIRLGTGGLVKAYGGGVQAALKLLPTTEKNITVLSKIVCDYPSLALLESILSNYGAISKQVEFKQDVEMNVEIDARLIEQLKVEVTNRFKGRIIIKPIQGNSN